METPTARDADEGIAIVPETDPIAIYAFLGNMFLKKGYDVERSERVFAGRRRKLQRRALRHGDEWLLLKVGPGEHEGFKEYAAFHDDKQVFAVEVSEAYVGLVVPERVNAETGGKAIGTEVFKIVRMDAAKVGATLWPPPPGSISETELRIWWEIDRAAVGFYPECAGLDLNLDGEDAENVEYARHLLVAERIKTWRELAEANRAGGGESQARFTEAVGRLLKEAKRWGCADTKKAAVWMNTVGKVSTRRGKEWNAPTVTYVGKAYEGVAGERVLPRVSDHGPGWKPNALAVETLR